MEWSEKPATKNYRPPTFRQLKFFSYIRYFLYVAWHWNLPLAIFVIYHERRGEKKYGISTIGYDDLKSLEEKGIDISHATMYMPANYFGLDRIFDAMKSINSCEGHFLDLGCGKGRTLVVAAYYGFKKVTGVDFSKSFCDEARLLAESVKDGYPNCEFRVQHQDAFYYEIPDDVNVIYLFNPFDEVIMSGVVSNILKSLRANPRTMYIMYINPQHEKLFTEEGFKREFHYKTMKFLEGVILKSS